MCTACLASQYLRRWQCLTSGFTLATNCLFSSCQSSSNCIIDHQVPLISNVRGIPLCQKSLWKPSAFHLDIQNAFVTYQQKIMLRPPAKYRSIHTALCRRVVCRCTRLIYTLSRAAEHDKVRGWSLWCSCAAAAAAATEAEAHGSS